MTAEDARYNAANALLEALMEAGLVDLSGAQPATTEGFLDYARNLLDLMVEPLAGALENASADFDDASGTGE